MGHLLRYESCGAGYSKGKVVFIITEYQNQQNWIGSGEAAPTVNISFERKKSKTSRLRKRHTMYIT